VFGVLKFRVLREQALAELRAADGPRAQADVPRRAAAAPQHPARRGSTTGRIVSPFRRARRALALLSMLCLFVVG
jgi:hypothetical protein